jgi:hypothetical protein
MRSQVPRLVAWIFCSAIGAAFADEPLRLADCRLESTVAGAASQLAAATIGCGRIATTCRQKNYGVAVIGAAVETAADPLFILSGGPGRRPVIST